MSDLNLFFPRVGGLRLRFSSFELVLWVGVLVNGFGVYGVGLLGFLGRASLSYHRGKNLGIKMVRVSYVGKVYVHITGWVVSLVSGIL